MRFRVGAVILAASFIIAADRPVFAQAWPDRSVRIIVPTAPGGAIDASARTVGEKLAIRWGQPVIIENRPGASMRIGAEAVARSTPDGYTLLVAHDGTMAMNPVVFPKLPYDPVKDFAPIGLIASIPGVVLTSKKVPVSSLAELVELARKEPGKLNHAHGGSATLLWLELFKAMTSVDIRSVPFQGGAPAVTAVIGGHVELCFADVATAVAGMQSDQVRPLAITSLTPSKRYPSLPTADKAGVPGYEAVTWMGMFAPAGLPRAIEAEIENGLKAAVAMDDVRSKLEAIGMDMRSGSAAEMTAVLAADMAKWAKLVSDRKIQFPQ